MDQRYPIIDAPDDLADLIIYEIATKNFTSPDGPESGTFASTEERLDYLERLGVNAIWLSGHQWCEPHHFYNIWTEYACIRPDRLDPSLGTEAEFRHLIDAAHAHGMKVFLDVITHGVMKDSPLVEEHPDWFAGGSWGMRDFDWHGGHADLDDWWVATWLRYVTDFGVDGYRLDVAHYRNDLWARLRREAADAGKRIVIIAESGPAIRGVTDILQHGEVIAHNYGLNRSTRLINDVAGYCSDKQTRAGERYEVRIAYEDGTTQTSAEPTWHQDHKVPEVIEEPPVTRVVDCLRAGAAYQLQTGRLRVENVHAGKAIRNVQVIDKAGHVWNSSMDDVLEVDYTVGVERTANGLLLEFPLRVQDGQFLSIQLSCHDGGWIGFPSGVNPYTAQGSRWLAGYAALLAPGVPVLMAGEEFNADYRPVPYLSPELFGGERFGEGRWLYGSWIDWEQLNDPDKAAMLEDVRRIIGIRRSERGLIRACRMGSAGAAGAAERNFNAVRFTGEPELPVPYCYRSEDVRLVVCANPSAEQASDIRLWPEDVFSPNELDLRWRLTAPFGSLPGDADELTMTGRALADICLSIGPDHTPQGGLLVLRLERIASVCA